MEYVTKVSLEVNGQEITDFKSVTEGERELRKKIKLMNKTGFVKTTPDFTVQVEYMLPTDDPEFDFESVENGTLTIDKENGVRITYTGVSTLKIGEAKYDGENEMTQVIDLGATGRIEN
jgi:hypothetical protein